MLSKNEQELLNKISNVFSNINTPISIRLNGAQYERKVSDTINIVTKKDKPGIDVFVKANAKGQTVQVPAIVSEGGIKDIVYNTFDIGENSEVEIIAGCGICNESSDNTEHDGTHEIIVRKNAKVKYIEKHIGIGHGHGKRILSPSTVVEVMEGGFIEMDTTQIKGVDDAVRETIVYLHDNAKAIIKEKIMSAENQKAVSKVNVFLEGENSSAQVISKSVSRDNSHLSFFTEMTGKNKCKGHIQCDSIIMDNARVESTPKISAMDSQAELIHEAAIGRIESDQLTKLMTLGIEQNDAEKIIIDSFLK